MNIPTGYRLLKPGEIIKKGDLYRKYGSHIFNCPAHKETLGKAYQPRMKDGWKHLPIVRKCEPNPWTCVADKAPTKQDANQYGWVVWRFEGMGSYTAHLQNDPENLAWSWRKADGKTQDGAAV